MSNHKLFNEFSEVSAKQWKQKIQFELNGEDYNEKLVWESPEGIKVKPFYNSEDIFENNTIPRLSNSWLIAQAVFAANAEMANKKALKALSKGAESIVFTIPSEDTEIETLLKNINLKTTILYFDFQFLSPTYIKKLNSLNEEGNAGFFLNFDCIGQLCKTGNWFFNLEKDFQLVNEILKENKNITLSINASIYQNAGANHVQQLAYTLAHANEYLNTKEENLLSETTFIFKIAVGSNYFFEIAKIRALRILWQTLATAYGISKECHILAIPSKRNKTIYDYNSNMLRTTTECMSAILGGADTICNLPYDVIYHKDNAFGERIARNQLVLLKEESYLDKTTNPSNGSYYIESLTKQLAEKALELFKLIEKSGGFLAQLKNNAIQKKIKESAQKEQELFNNHKEILVGTNKYVSNSDKMKDAIELYPFIKNKARKTIIEPIIEKRLSEEVEQKRLNDE
tara:strand:+ start:4723 stop:6093 length:1371 start_codon:yes stop_codon:yes gene_type:complete